VEDFKSISQQYFFDLALRVKASKVYQPHQLIGLRLAELLNDLTHKSLYMKLAKKHDGNQLLALAGSIAENKNVNNKGAYFMSVFFGKKPNANSHRQQPRRDQTATPPTGAF
jgi:hypothetical protein